MIFLKNILNIIFPTRCVYCKKKDNEFLCSNCINTIPFQKTTQHDFIFYAFPYRHPVVKKALWELKFSGKKEIAHILAKKAYEILLDELQDKNIYTNFQNPILVPIPLHAKRYKERGFNQSELIAKSLHEQNPSLFEFNTKNLIRSRYTKPQAKITTKSERLSNISSCFQVIDPQVFHRRNIILIDDITTTGATLLEARKILKKTGAREVYGFTLAQ